MTEADNIIPGRTYAVAKPPRRKFAPWHKPRKQHVREQQWAEEARWLLSQRRAHSGAFRYLTLPGADLLDIRYLHEQVCVPLNQSLYFLGFDRTAAPNAKDHAAHNVAMREVRELEHVVDASTVLEFDIRQLAREGHLAWQRTRQFGPFDAINLDLCGHVTTEEPGLDDSLYTTLDRLFDLQDRRPDPWVLLLTTRLDRDAVDAGTLARLDVLIADNLRDCQQFRESLEGLLGMQPVNPHIAGTWQEQQQCDLLAVQIGKWLLKLALKINSKLSLQSCLTYRVNTGSEVNDMASFAFRITPLARSVPDPTRLAVAGAGNAQAECVQAAALTQGVEHAVDVDNLLLADSSLREYLVEQTLALLRPHYDEEAYRRWVADS